LYLSIKIKYIGLLSLLMAVILLVQFYFMYRTQNDTINELTEISSSINRTTDAIFIDRIKHMPDDMNPDNEDSIYYKSSDLSEDVLKLNPETSVYSFNIDSNLVKITDRAKRKIYKGNQSTDIRLNPVRRREKQDRIIRRIPLPEGFILEKQWHSADSLNLVLEEIEINLNQRNRSREDSLLIIAKNTQKALQEYKYQKFQFSVPDFSHPAEPKIISYHYNTADFQLAMDNMRNRNMLISISVFLASIGAIMLITSGFLKPIESLKRSFDKLVDGDLSVTVPTNSKDEMGDLARSFNHMVNELRKNKEKEALIQRKERLASLGQLAAGVAHEIKNPLNAINLTIDHLNDKYIPADNKQAAGYITTIQSEIRRLDKIVNNFLNYVRSEELHKQFIDLNNGLEEVLNLYGREITASGINLTFYKTGPYPAFADPERFKTAIGNLVLNAIQAMPEGGSLTITSNPDSGFIEIADSGRGIPEELMTQVFDLFYTTKTNGTGLGLPTAYRIIKEHNGEIELKSQAGKGTSVIVRIPTVKPDEIREEL